MAKKRKFQFKSPRTSRTQYRSVVEEKRLHSVMGALKAIHSSTSPDTMKLEDLEHQRRSQKLLGSLFAPRIGMAWERFTIKGIPAAWTRPEYGHDRKRAILYCHGGGYTSGNLGYARVLCGKMAAATGYDTLSFEYRLAPEHPYPAAVEDAVAVWDYLMYLGYGAKDIVLAGDSAGGNLALVLTQRLHEMGRRLPRALVLLSPWTDMTASGPSYQEQAQLDPMLTIDYIKNIRHAYAGDVDYALPIYSPLFGQFEGFPPTLIQVGENEILRSDSMTLRDRMVEQGVPCRLEIWDDMWHVFQMFPMKQAAEAMEHVGDFLLDLF